MNGNTIKFGDNAPTSVTFKYGNVTLCESMRGGDPYYRFDCEEGRINASKPLAEAIAANWPGSGGRVRFGHQQFYILMEKDYFWICRLKNLQS